ncbi:sensor domain-containing diguanylate cyclase [Pseudidiomarina insulisalsae]|uniref:Sensor domain-containing diguanylate cyclase n=1 Tax=Pseudidiomarina insulisalsae TaxID=575789 RepID=A0A432YQG5_9GAMM|nr:sensor domain-containing diguanylate cyclase [Pseudidiomarina insulisalsae]RUO63615.1 hypothetical protein CWI71_00685 [Pseudidiomarina insulisalsae]
MDEAALLKKLPGITYQLQYDAQGKARFTFLCGPVQSLLGLEAEALKENATAFFAAIPASDRETLLQDAILDARQGRDGYHPFRYTRPDGRVLRLDAHHSAEELGEGRWQWTGYLVEGNYRHTLEDALAASEQRFETLVKNASDIIFTIDGNGIIGYLSPNYEWLVGDAPEDTIHQSFVAVVHPNDAASCNAYIQSILSGSPAARDIEFRVRHSDEKWHWYTCRASKIAGHNIQPDYLLGIAREITEQRQQREKLARMAREDMLTSLPNRAYFEELFEQTLALSAQQQKALAVLFIDLDHFKAVNDTHGHSIGDQLLIHAARRIKSCLRDADVACRAGGDEFVVLTNNFADSSMARQIAACIAERIRQELAQPFSVEQLQLTISASIGIAIFPEHADSASDLLRRADQAMYAAKLKGRNRVLISDPEVLNSDKR